MDYAYFNDCTLQELIRNYIYKRKYMFNTEVVLWVEFLCCNYIEEMQIIPYNPKMACHTKMLKVLIN
jgi:hypothetical protein